MSPLKALLGLSLAANVALLAVWSRPKEVTTRNSAETATEAAAASESAPKTSSGGPAVATNARSPDAELTSATFKSELERVVRQLEAAGFPRRMIVAVAENLMKRTSAATYAQLRWQDKGAQAYWKSPASDVDPNRSRELTRLNREIQATLEAVLGPDYFLEIDGVVTRLHAEYGPLAPEKLVRIQALRKDYDELRQEMFSEWEAGVLVDPREKERSIQEAFRAELAQLLTAQELFEYDVRSSETARRLRDQFQVLDLSEPEFRSLFTLYQTLDRQYPEVQPNNPNWSKLQRERREAEAKLLEQAKASFSAERAAQLAQAADPSARQENRLVARLGLPLSTAAELSAVRRDVWERLGAVRRDRNLPEDQRQQTIVALTGEAEQRVLALLGQRGLAAYRESAGQWIEQLRKPPQPPR